MITRRALIVVDVQQDFLPGGALWVPGGEQVLPVIERMAPDFDVVVATGDWHPEDTRHFEKWPVHCVAGTGGARIHPRVTGLAQALFHKGQSHEDDGYSGFEGRGGPNDATLGEYLAALSVTSVTVVGLALDFCVKATALDAARREFLSTEVALAGTRPVSPGARGAAIHELRLAGVKIS